MLGDRFLQVNGTRIPNPAPGTFKITFDPIENIELSEAGTEIGSVQRLNKREFSGTWQVSSYWLGVLEGFCELRTVEVVYRDKAYRCRARGFDPQLFNNSEYVESSDGLWSINLTFTEI